MTSARVQKLQVLALIAGARATAPVSRRAAGWFAGRLWFTPWKVVASPASLEREAAWLDATRPRTWTVEGRTVAGFEAGDGPVVLLVHGWGDRSGVLGGLIAPLVRAGYRVVGFDLPAHGASHGRRTDVPAVARAIVEISADFGGVEAIVAHSLGGAATVAALGQGVAAERVALIAPAVRLQHAVAQFTQLFGLPRAAVDGLRADIERRFGASVWDDFAGDRIAPALSAQALIVHDADDPQVAPADSELLAAAWPGARLHRTAGLGHRKILRDPQVIAMITQFVTQAPAQLRA